MTMRNILGTTALAALVAGALVMHGCARDDIVIVQSPQSTVDDAFARGTFMQVERLGRPLPSRYLQAGPPPAGKSAP